MRKGYTAVMRWVHYKQIAPKTVKIILRLDSDAVEGVEYLGFYSFRVLAGGYANIPRAIRVNLLDDIAQKTGTRFERAVIIDEGESEAEDE